MRYSTQINFDVTFFCAKKNWDIFLRMYDMIWASQIFIMLNLRPTNWKILENSHVVSAPFIRHFLIFNLASAHVENNRCHAEKPYQWCQRIGHQRGICWDAEQWATSFKVGTGHQQVVVTSQFGKHNSLDKTMGWIVLFLTVDKKRTCMENVTPYMHIMVHHCSRLYKNSPVERNLQDKVWS